NTEEARQLAEGNPESFLHIIRPEIDLPEDTSFNHPDVYKKGAANLQRFIEEQILIQDDGPDAYLYQLKLNNHSQTGLFCCVSVDEYDNEVILKHELTRPAKEDDRTKHILTQQAHTEPVMLTYQGNQSRIIELQKKVMQQKPAFSFNAEDGV